MKKLLLIVSFLLITTTLFAQVDVDISAQVRPRLELDNKDFNSDTKVNTFTGMRSRLGFNLSRKNVEIFIQAQDTRIWGTEGGTMTDTKNLDLHQAYLQISDLFCGFDLKLGRMEAIYGPQRLIGAVGWSNVGRSFDGALLKYKSSNFDLDFFVYQEVESQLSADLGDKYFSGLYGSIKATPKYKIEPFLLWDRDITGKVSRFTAGAYIKGDVGALSHEVEAAYQLGDKNGLDVASYMAALNLKYNISKQFTLGGGIDILSGDEDPLDDKYEVFHTLYATNHKYYGFMDYFINIPAATYGLGLRDIHVKASLATCEKFTISAAFHMFNSMQDALLPDNTEDNSFGSEIDLTFAHKYNQNVKFQAGVSFFMPGEIFEQMKGEDNSSWAYFMVVVGL